MAAGAPPPPKHWELIFCRAVMHLAAVSMFAAIGAQLFVFEQLRMPAFLRVSLTSFYSRFFSSGVLLPGPAGVVVP